MTALRHLAPWLLATGYCLAAGAAGAEPIVLTGANQPLIGTPTYVVPYAISTPPAGTPISAETVITVGNRAPGAVCNVQVEWRTWAGILAGVSGPIPLPADNTVEFTTHAMPAGTWPPGTLNVFSNLTAPFEGHAKVRSSCPTSAKLRINAQKVVNNLLTRTVDYVHIKVTKLPGNVGD